MGWNNNEFAIFLVVGLLIIAVLIVGFSAAPAKGEPAVAKPEVVIKTLAGAQQVGPKLVERFVNFNFLFDTEHVRETQAFELGDKTLQNGFLFSEVHVQHALNIRGISSATVSFTVKDANKLEPLQVSVNDKVVYNEISPPGKYSISIPDDALEDNSVIVIRAVSSGWKIWAPNIYELEDIRIEASGFVQKDDSFTFTLDEEQAEGMAQLTLAFDENAGSLSVFLNDHKIFSGVPKDLQPLRSAALKEGENRLNFIADKDSRFSGKAILTIFFNRVEEQVLRTPLNLTRPEWNGINTSFISFDVVNVVRAGGLSIKIFSGSGVLFSEFTAVRGSQHFDFAFTKQNVRPGLNVLEIKSVDGALFTVAQLGVVLR